MACYQKYTLRAIEINQITFVEEIFEISHFPLRTYINLTQHHVQNLKQSHKIIFVICV